VKQLRERKRAGKGNPPLPARFASAARSPPPELLGPHDVIPQVVVESEVPRQPLVVLGELRPLDRLRGPLKRRKGSTPCQGGAAEAL
jgi:hypothetical protein